MDDPVLASLALNRNQILTMMLRKSMLSGFLELGLTSIAEDLLIS